MHYDYAFHKDFKMQYLNRFHVKLAYSKLVKSLYFPHCFHVHKTFNCGLALHRCGTVANEDNPSMVIPS